jgi:chitodextrinase
MVVAAITVLSIQTTLASPAASTAPDRAEFPSVHLAGTVSGREAVSALGNQLPAIARAYGTTAQELATRLQLDRTLHVDRGGRLLYACNAPKATVTTIGSSGAATATTPAALSDTFVLHSRPGATKVVYLDFVGFTTSGTIWNSSFRAGADFTTPPYDIDGNPSAFSDTELARIQGIWERVAEDYSPFDVDVTTEDPGVEALRKTSSTDANYGIRVCIGGSCYDWYGASAGGVSFVGAFSWSSDTPNYVFTAQLGNGDEKYTAEAVSHEVGHTLGLSHDGVLPSTAYYSGQGSGATGWAPIMGVGYYQPVVQWSKGDYANANNTQDDLAIIASYVGYRPDDHGDTAATATYLPVGAQISATGVIGSQSDVDVVAFTTGAGTVSLTLGGDLRSPNLDLAAELRDASGNVVATSNPAAGLGATLGATLPAGTYFVFVHGAACGDPLTTGYSAYGSIGQWGLKGTVIDPNGGVAPVAVAKASATTGVAPATIVFDGTGSFDQDGFVTGYLWTFSDGTSAGGATVSKSFAAAGTYTATVTVTDNAGLTGSASVAVSIAAPNQAPVCIASVSAS